MSETKTEAVETPSGKEASGENFPVGSFLIRKDLRPDVHAYYLFARGADDIGDNPLLDANDKIARLDLFEKTLLTPGEDAVAAAVPLRETIMRRALDPALGTDLLVAFKRDAVKRRYENWGELLDYCRYSANPVGRFLLDLHGESRDTWPAGDALCTALQIINHIQDCADDYRELDRVYIPLDMLASHGGDPAMLSGAASTPALRATLDDMIAKTEPLLAQALTLPPMIKSKGLRMEVSVIATLAARLISLLKKRDPLCEPMKLSKLSVLMGTLQGIGRAIF